MLGGNGLQQFLLFGIFILLARYLDADAFGYVALAAGVFDIASAVGRWGLNDVILQRRKPGALLLSHAFIFVMVLAVILVCVTVAGTLAYVAIHGWTLIAQLMLFLAPAVLLQAAEMVPETVIRRRMDFKWLALRNNIAALVSGVAAVILAVQGYGVYALVVQRLLGLAILVIFVWWAAGRAIRIFPRNRYRKKMFAGLGLSGSHMVSGPLTMLLSSRLIDIMVGVFLGAAALGYLKIARRIYEFVAELAIMPLANVALAVFSRLVAIPAQLRSVYKRMQGVCALGVLPLFAGVALTAPMWVPLLLGPQWMAAIVLIQLTAPACVSGVVNYFQLPLLIVFRRNRLISGQNIARLASSILLTAAGLPFGLEVVVVLSVLQGYAFMIYNLVMLKKIAGWSVAENLGNLVPAVVGTSVMMAAVLLYSYVMQPQPGWWPLVMVSGLGAATYALVLLLGFRDQTYGALREALRLLRSKSDDAGAEKIM